MLGKWNFIFLLGESGGGKGTLVKNIKKHWISNLRTTSMGDIFREKAKTDEKIKELTEKGELVDDELAVQIFKEFAVENSPGLIDGFPRNRSQVLKTIKFAKELGWRILVVDLKCDIEVIIERLLARGRADDKLEIMYKRNLDHRTLHPFVMQEIKNRPDLFDIITLDGNKPSEVVSSEFFLSLLRDVDLLHLYDKEPLTMKLKVNSDEVSIDSALNRCLSELLHEIQDSISK